MGVIGKTLVSTKNTYCNIYIYTLYSMGSLENLTNIELERLNNKIYLQNETLKENIKEKKEVFSTDNQLFNYNTTYLERLNKINGVLLALYYILAVGVAVMLFLSKSITMGIYMKIMWIVVMAIFPFIYLWVEMGAWNIMRYIYAVIGGGVYVK
jgi:hypothetical protein